MAQKIVPKKAPAPTGLSMAEMIGAYQKATEPRLNQLSLDTMRNLDSISNIRSVSPEAVSKMAGTSVPVSATLGFNDTSQLFGMLPDEYQAMVAPKETPTQLFNRQLDLVDKVTNIPEKRRMLSDAILRNQTQMGQNIQAGANAGVQSQAHLDSQKFQAGIADVQNDLTAQNANVSHALQAQQLAEVARHNKVIETEQKMVRAALAAQGAHATGIPYSAPWSDALQRQMQILAGGKGYDPEKKTWNFDEIAQTANWPAFTQKYMEAEALGQPVGTVRHLQGAWARAAGGYNEVMLTPQGWYGVKRNNAGKIIQGQPVWDLFGKGGKSGADAGAYEMVPRYTGAQ